MKNFHQIVPYYIYIAALLAIVTTPAYASSPIYDALRDERGGFIRDSRDNCVRTNQQVSVDPCMEVTEVIISESPQIAEVTERVIIYFDFDQSIIKAEEKEKLKNITEALKLCNIAEVGIAGYADRIGTEEYNYKLSERRANAVKESLGQLISLEDSIVDVIAFGKKFQIVSCEDITQRDKLISCLTPNRRVELDLNYYERQ